VSKRMVPEGYSISGLAREFGMSTRTVAKRLEGVPACGKRGTAVLYRLADAAPAILRGKVAPTHRG
jgi:predicted transcriptional regulator